ncbi:MAG TPA: tRNA (guanosine(46)-N7)-methyltransferase TrmB [Pyrinomonadaceae bacterium]|nr:tRNA (guanosine(46)-N7)-methyltransferase TrmB [Pyrinomonadaceae bacterium]
MARVRVHQHVNPHSPYYRQEPEPVDLATLFEDPTRPLLLDIGCARGRFLLKMAEALPEWNYLGVEIREPLVDEANRLAREAELTNLHYVFCNAMLFIDMLIADIPDGVLQQVTIQFPDPWFKRKHSKRRMVNEEMVKAIFDKLAPDGRVFVQTDIEFLADEMFELFRGETRAFEIPTVTNPFPIRTEREKAVEDKELPVYRAVFKVQPSAISS